MLILLVILTSVVALSPAGLYLAGRIRDPFHPLVWAGAATFFFLPYQLWVNWNASNSMVPDQAVFNRFMVVITISVLGMYAGWAYWGRRHRSGVRESGAPPHYEPTKILFAAILFLIVALPIHFLYSVDFENRATSYLADLDRLWMPAAILLTQLLFLYERHARWWIFLLLGVALVPPFERFFAYGQRSDTIRIAAFAELYYLMATRRPAKVTFLWTLVVLGIVVASLTTTRRMIMDGEADNRIDALMKAVPQYVRGELNETFTGSEWIFGSVEVETVRQSGQYGYGRSITIGVIGRFLPRQFFPNKDAYTVFHGGYDATAIKYWSGLVISGGAAPTGFANGFMELWWACPIIWFIIGYVYRLMWDRSVNSQDLRYKGYLIGYSIAMVFAITQDLLTAEVNAIFVILPLAVVYKIAQVPSPALLSLPGAEAAA